jgi:crotonobetaine/carnitine-CoA ligase
MAGRWRTFSEQDKITDRLAAGLASLGLVKGDRLAFLLPNRPELLEIYFAAAKIGVVLVPLNPFLKGEFLRYQVHDCGAAAIVVDDLGWRQVLPLLAELKSLKTVVHAEPLPNEPPAVNQRLVSYGQIHDWPDEPPQVDVVPADLAAIMYTSGTTGLPKGCMLSNGYYSIIPRAYLPNLRITPDDVIFSALPLFHMSAQIAHLIALMCGCATAYESVFSARDHLRQAGDVGATVLWGVGSMAAAILAQPNPERDPRSRIRVAGWVPLAPSQQIEFEKRFGIPVTNMGYGQTEAVPITLNSLGEETDRINVGRAAPHLEVKVVDDDDNDVQADVIGEIVVRSLVPNGIFQGYWNKPDATVAAFRNLWHHTGDFGRMSAKGDITFVDRKKDALRRRGENVSSVEVEIAIGLHPKVAQVAVHAVKSQMTEDDIKACIVLRAGEHAQPNELFEYFRDNLPFFAVPRYVELVEALPLNGSGKVLKTVLRERGVTPDTWDFEAMGLTIGRERRR